MPLTIMNCTLGCDSTFSDDVMMASLDNFSCMHALAVPEWQFGRLQVCHAIADVM